ncbi:hypothetical protein CONPUDRAFT_162084 [Coniophora puteana RWD-64-598 SS2]|uniref:DUF6534 domain-containing protein n=1 Tax=Coniophora puteana (strain RWD-64-598) TaxID=741705 RepID=A0A5M3N0D9_CONPW|nr:uncharacterized protein CONPUDRAFT_162084 [Coniophora puteana RWD-64-598 SS2]EIW84736.1 hypothetical protein CONPUDRAFT_162084 [Coniophora puteana RWD-64-598 SS2]
MLRPDLLIGPALVGVIFNAFLTGCFSVQTYVYYTRYSSDRWEFKSMASLLAIFEFVKFASELYGIWELTVAVVETGNTPLVTTSAAMKIVALLTPLTDGTVQSFFIFRLWRISRSLAPALVGILLLVTSQVSGYMAVARVFNATSELVLASEVSMRIIMGLAFGARVMCDGWTSAFVVLYLRSIRQTVRFGTERSAFGKLILWTVETGVRTSIVTAVVLVTYLVCGPTNYVWMAPFAIIGSVYANVLLATMNGRWILQGHWAGDEECRSKGVNALSPT